MNKEEISDYFDTCGYYLENGDIEYFDDPSYLSEIEQIALDGMKCGLKARSLYYLGLIDKIRGENDKAIDRWRHAALNGHTVAAIEYANSVGLEDIETLGIIKAYIDAGQDVAQPAYDDYKYFIKKISSDEMRRVIEVAEDISNTVNTNGCGFVYL